MRTRFYAIIACIVLYAAGANAEVITAVTTGEAIRPVPKEVKVAVQDFQSVEGRSALMERLRREGFNVIMSVRDADYRVGTMRVGLVVMVDGKKTEINLDNKDEHKGLSVPPAIQSATSVASSTQTGDVGRKRGALDMDAGVISQGAAMTGSGAGGLVVGVIGALIGMAVDGMVQNKKADDLPAGVAVLRGSLSHGKGKEAKAVDVVIAAASDVETTPDVLFNAVIDRYARLVADGHEPRPQQSADTASAAVASQ
jgi:hypothetical protein